VTINNAALFVVRRCCTENTHNLMEIKATCSSKIQITPSELRRLVNQKPDPPTLSMFEDGLMGINLLQEGQARMEWGHCIF
jgi:hypothetical protein